MHRTILEQLAESRVPQTSLVEVEPSEINVKVVGRFVWDKLAAACTELPLNRGLMVACPEGMNVKHLQSLVRSALSMNSQTMMDKFSIRQAKDEKSVFVLKAGTWNDPLQELGQ